MNATDVEADVDPEARVDPLDQGVQPCGDLRSGVRERVDHDLRVREGSQRGIDRRVQSGTALDQPVAECIEELVAHLHTGVDSSLERCCALVEHLLGDLEATAKRSGDGIDERRRTREVAQSRVEGRCELRATVGQRVDDRLCPIKVDVERCLQGQCQVDIDVAQSVDERVDADMALHRTIVVASHNEVLIELFDGFVPRVRRAMIDMLRIRPTASEREDHDAHAAVVEAIAARTPDAAAGASRTHLDALKAALS